MSSLAPEAALNELLEELVLWKARVAELLELLEAPAPKPEAPPIALEK